jgi:hypothetical protein
MKRLALLCLAFGCQKEGAAAEDPHASPEAAARCELAAFRAKSVDRFLECIHPDLRAEFKKELDEEERKDPAFWTDGAARLAPLEKARASDFVLEPMPAGKESYGDQMASFAFADHGKIELVRRAGKWYVVDPD